MGESGAVETGIQIAELSAEEENVGLERFLSSLELPTEEEQIKLKDRRNHSSYSSRCL